VPAGSTAAQVEGQLELNAGKGANTMTTKTPASNLAVPENGPTTSGGAWQRQLKSDTPVDPKTIKKTGG
jgi:hypothetical protein